MKTLEECRQEIDEIDQQMIRLFEKRMNVGKDVVLYKKAHQMQIFQPDREKLVIEKNVGRMENEKLKKYGAMFIQSMMDISKDYQFTFLDESLDLTPQKPLTPSQDLKVGFQGVEGAFGELALRTYFKENVAMKHYDEFEEVFKALDRDEIDYGIVPIENSSTGAINNVYDLIRNYGLYIVGEQSISISQNLLGLKQTKLDEVREVYSHPQGLAQSSKFLQNYPNMKQIPYNNTAMAAKLIASMQDPTKAAIASKQAAKLYGLTVLKENIHNDLTNHTRFIIIGKNLENVNENNRISILCSLEHRVGALSTILNIIKESELNMVRIESRPIPTLPWQYYFYIDFEGNIENPLVEEALNKISRHTQKLRILGTYKQS